MSDGEPLVFPVRQSLPCAVCSEANASGADNDSGRSDADAMLQGSPCPFAGWIAHDLNNVLQLMMGALELSLQSTSATQQRFYVRRSLDLIDRAARLVRERAAPVKRSDAAPEVNSPPDRGAKP